MDFWQYAFIFVLVAGGLAILGRLIVHSTKPAALKDGGLPPQRDPALDAARERFRDGGTMRFGEPRGDAGFRPSVRQAAISQVYLTPRNLSLINARRSARGLPMLNRRGFQAAIAAQRPNYSINHDDWLTYLILYECLIADHTGRTPDTSITVTPDAPFNGQGGTFAGAGASGDWPTGGDPAPATIEPGSHGSVALGLGLAGAAVAGAAGLAPDPLSDPNSYKGGDRPDPSDGNPEAYSPPQSAPEPSRAPEPSYDSGGSSGGGDSGGSSSSSSSYDSGGSSGGGDSGGGGGGDSGGGGGGGSD